MDALQALLVERSNYFAYILLLSIGLYAILGKRNLLKKVIGLNIFQTSIILFFVSVGAKRGATLPIVRHGHEGLPAGPAAAGYINPLPHVLMLTAIVVAVATLGVALALVIRMYRDWETLEEDEIVRLLREEGRRGGGQEEGP